MKMRQAHLKHNNTHMITWLDDHPKLKAGVRVTLKDDPDLWEVLSVTDASVDKACLYKPWHVGGL